MPLDPTAHEGPGADPRPPTPDPCIVARRPTAPTRRPIHLPEAVWEAARREISSWPEYRPTPLLSLEDIAQRTGVRHVYYKDEADRFGLGSFKGPGGAFGVVLAIARHLDLTVPEGGLRVALSSDRLLREHVGRLSVTCATDGNHGLAVAWAAAAVGCQAVVYLPDPVSETRESEIAALGAEVVRVSGSYDEAVRACQRDATRFRRLVVSDTAYAGNTDVPKAIMAGYGLLFQEISRQLPADRSPTHLFVQGGVGGLAGAACSFVERFWPDAELKIVVVEPRGADCLFRSARVGRATTAPGPHHTIMTGMACGEPSIVAWPILADRVDFFMVIDDNDAERAIEILARSRSRIDVGPSGAAGTGAFLAAREDRAMSDILGLHSDSVVVLLGTEGATPRT